MHPRVSAHPEARDFFASVARAAHTFVLQNKWSRAALTAGTVTHRKVIPMDAETVARFWAKVDKRGPDECWGWLGLKRGGYGRFKAVGGKVIASRVAYALVKGAIPLGLCVCHSCDNPACCNPAHLFLGSHGENARDRDAKGRQASGERCALSKLKDADVRWARWEREHNGTSYAAIARKLGVTAPNVSAICTGKTWKHVLPG